MKPPMKQKVTAYIPLLNDDGTEQKDKRGFALTETKESKARVQFKSQVIRDAQGQDREVNLEIDIPPEFNPNVGVKVDYKMIDGRTASGIILAKDEAVNLSGSKVYYRTVYVDG